MLARALSSWSKLLRLGQGASTVEEERRLWGRIPCEVETTCQAAGGEGGDRLSARVQNISRGGVNLLLGRAFEPGALLSVALPGTASTEVLACVVRCEARDGGWQLGCTFASPLADEDLERIERGAGRTPAREQRGRTRYPCHAQALYQVVRTPELSERRPVVVLNVSASGIALQGDEPLRVGELLSLELSRDGTAVLTTLASVVRTDVTEEGARVAGCNFIHELAEEQVGRLL
jgi:hypothetical protein